MGEVLCPGQYLSHYCGSTKGVKLICKPAFSMENIKYTTASYTSIALCRGRASRMNFRGEYILSSG